MNAWSVRSLTDSDGRRVILFGRWPALPGQARQQAGMFALRLKRTLRQQVTFAREELSAFQPVIQHPARRRGTDQLALQLCRPAPGDPSETAEP